MRTGMNTSSSPPLSISLVFTLHCIALQASKQRIDSLYIDCIHFMQSTLLFSSFSCRIVIEAAH